MSPFARSLTLLSSGFSFLIFCFFFFLYKKWLLPHLSLVPTLVKLFDFPDSILACLGNVSVSFPCSWSLFPLSVQFLFSLSSIRSPLSSLASFLLNCVRTDCSCELRASSKTTQLSKVHSALQGSLPWEQADHWTSQILLSQNSGLSFCYSSCLLLLLTFCWLLKCW